MLTAITHSAIFVTDQDEALDFYVGKLGLEVAQDIDMGFMRWLTVRVPGQPEREILLEVPGPPAVDEATGDVVRELLAKGGLGLGFIITVDDCRKSYEELKAKGVEFTQEPVDRFYGVDVGIRDPFGNNLRMTEPVQGPMEIPTPGEEPSYS
ncbi:MAG TPA: VOC family protein [Solirubrobacteraceae bacterium]